MLQKKEKENYKKSHENFLSAENVCKTNFPTRNESFKVSPNGFMSQRFYLSAKNGIFYIFSRLLFLIGSLIKIT